MKTKRTNLKAVMPAGYAPNQAYNWGQEKETIDRIVVVDKKTERRVVDLRLYMGRSKQASGVYSALWVWGMGPSPINVSGGGAAHGYGYCKRSSAAAAAISCAGIKLYGSAYRGQGPIDMKQVAHIGGAGMDAVEDALLAIAYAVGCKAAIIVGV